MNYTKKEEFKNLNPTSMLNIIDSKFYYFKKKEISRFSEEWGLWSRQMNLSIRERLENSIEPANIIEGLKYVYIYWVIRSNQLGLAGSKNPLSFLKNRKLENEAGDIKRIIEKELFGALEEVDFKRLVGSFSGRA